MNLPGPLNPENEPTERAESRDLLRLLSEAEAKLSALLSEPTDAQGHTDQELLAEIHQAVSAARERVLNAEDGRFAQDGGSLSGQALREREQRFRTLADGTPAILWATGSDGELEFVNQAYVDFFGVSLEQVQNQGWQPLVHPDDAAAYVGGFLDSTRERTPFRAEARVLRHDGAWRWVDSHGQPRFSQAGEYLGMAGSSLDVTERRQTEQALHEEEELGRLALEGGRLGTWANDLVNEETYWDARAREIFGVSPDEPVTLEIGFSVIHPEDRERARQAYEQAIDPASEGVYAVEKRIVHPDGSIRWVATRGRVSFEEHDGQRRAVRLVGVVNDITARKQAEMERERLLDLVQHERNKLSSVINSMNDEVWICDPQRNVVQLNPAVRADLGIEEQKALNRPLEAVIRENLEILRPDGSPRPLEETPLFRSLQGETLRGSEIVRHLHTGERRWREYSCAPIRSGSGEILGALAVVRDIQDIKQTEQALRESEGRFRAVLENSLDAAYRRDLQTDRYDYMSPVADQIFGFSKEEMDRMGIAEVVERIHPDDREQVAALIEQANRTGRAKIEYRFRHKDGRYRWLADYVTVTYGPDGRPRYRGGIVRDISEIKQSEEELRAWSRELEARVAERTEEVLEMQARLIDRVEAERTRLAREIHDGPMQDIYGLLFRVAGIGFDQPPEALKEELHLVRSDLLRINRGLRAISQELLPPTLANLGLGKAIQAHLDNLKPAHPELEARLEVQADGSMLEESLRLALFRIYQTSIANVLRHAQAQKVTIRFYLDAEAARLEIQDDGQGFEVPESLIDFARLGHLGLAGAQERAQSVGGRLQVVSQPGQGTTVQVEVPRQPRD